MIIVIVRFNDTPESPEVFGPFRTAKEADDWAAKVVEKFAGRGARCLITTVDVPFVV